MEEEKEIMMPKRSKQAQPSGKAVSKANGKRKKPAGKRKRKKKGGKEISVWWFVALAAVTMSVFVIAPLFLSRCSHESGVRLPEGNYGYAVDISKYQKGIVWDSLMVISDARGCTSKSIRSAKEIHRVKYVIVKATEGEKLTDALFDDHWKRSASAGYSRGAYHFFRSSKSPEKQAQNFISKVGNIRHKDLPPILDVETIHPGCSKAELNRKILVWLRAVENHYGRKPIVYTGDTFLRDHLSPEVYDHYPIWIARYGNSTTLTPPRHTNWLMWQFTDRATVYGIPTPCDLSVITEQGE